jgi:hypothetical protein
MSYDSEKYNPDLGVRVMIGNYFSLESEMRRPQRALVI